MKTLKCMLAPRLARIATRRAAIPKPSPHVWLWALLVAASIITVRSATTPDTIVAVGPHYRVVEGVVPNLAADGTLITRKSRRVDIATGLGYWDGKTWAESQELIEPDPNGAVAHFAQTKAAWAANLNTRGAVQIMDADGQQFIGNLIGIALTDSESGKSVMVAVVKDSIGQIIPPNQIVFNDAFTDIRANVTYKFTRAGVEQDITILEMSPALDPATYGMNAASCRLEAYTEWLAAPIPTVTTEVFKSEQDPQKRQLMAAPDIFDQEIQFGALAFGKGRAIDFQGAVTDDVPVARTWEVRDQRQFLVETIDFPAIAPALNALPRQQAKINNGLRMAKVIAPRPGQKTTAPLLPVLKQPAALDSRPMKLMARADVPSSKGVLWDWVVTLTSGLTNFVFRPEATHSVSGTINLYGTNTIMGGTVIKYFRGGAIALNGALICDTTPYHPAVFTAVDDNTLGDVVQTKTLSGYYAAAALRASSNVLGELHDLRISYAQTALDWKGSQDRFYNLQFINCSNAINRVDATNAPAHNILATNVLYVFTGSNTTFNAQHVTADNAGILANLAGTPAKLTLTNSILVNVSNAGTGTIQLDYIATNGTASLPAATHGWTASLNDFQASVGGYHYLSTNSALHDVGTTNIATNLLAEIRSLTTYAPALLTSTAQVNVTFSPIALRDNNTPDLGYEYAPLDYILRGYRLNTNVVLTMTNGVAVGIDYNGGSWGLIFDTATNISIGSPTNMNRVVLAWCVQERSLASSFQAYDMFYDINNGAAHGNSEARFRFTEFAGLGPHGDAIYTGRYWINWEWSHSWLYNISLNFQATNGSQTIGITNNLFEWGEAALEGSSSTFHARNNLFRMHSLTLNNPGSSWSFRDNLFDNASISKNAGTLAISHNAYYITTTNWPGGAGDIPLATLTYDTDPYGKYGAYGRYYQPANSQLIGAGSTNANVAGLFHFTATTNQVKETNSLVDIGPHYVALSVIGSGVDTDGDGLADYLEDTNGNGIRDGSESEYLPPYWDSDSDGMPDWWELGHGLDPFVNDANADPDGDGLTNLQEYFGGTDPHLADNFGLFLVLPKPGSNLP